MEISNSTDQDQPEGSLSNLAKLSHESEMAQTTNTHTTKQLVMRLLPHALLLQFILLCGVVQYEWGSPQLLTAAQASKKAEESRVLIIFVLSY